MTFYHIHQFSVNNGEKMKELITVIIPIYQVEKYLSNCVNSVLQQTYGNLEIILVDDGSIDRCPQICDEFAEKDKRIKVIHKTNGGLSDARNAGLDICKGKYITFIDSDDYVSQNYIELLYNALTSNRADVSMVDLVNVQENTSYCTDSVRGDVKAFPQKEAIIKGLNIRIRQCSCGNLYKSECFDNLRFPVGKQYEDLAVLFRILLKTKKIVVVRAPAYKYLIRNGSIMHSNFNARQLDEIEIIDNEMDNLILHFPEYKTMANGRRLYSYFVVLRRINASENANQYIQEKKVIMDKIRKYANGMLFKKDINMRLKSKILAFNMGESIFNKWMSLVESTYH